MATFKQRALTIATVGLLSGSPLTIATNGLIQQAEAPVTPPTEQPAPRVSGGGITHLEYAPLKRIVSDIRWALDIDSNVRYFHNEVSVLRHTSNLFYDLSVQIDTRYARTAEYRSEVTYALGIDADVLSDKLPDRPAYGFDYKLDISSAVTADEPLNAAQASEIDVSIEVYAVDRNIPASDDQNVYSNIHPIDVGILAYSSDRFIPAKISTTNNVSDIVIELDASTQWQAFNSDLSRYSYVSDTDVGVEYEFYSFIEKAPTDIRNEDEEVVLMLARLLLEEDD